MVTDFPTVSDNGFYFYYAFAGSKCEMFFWFCLILAHLVVHKISDWLIYLQKYQRHGCSNYCMAGNICGNYMYIVRFYCQTVQFFVCVFYLCDWMCPCPIITYANTFHLSGCAFGNLSFSSTGEVPTSLGCTVWAAYLPLAALSLAVICSLSHDDVPAFLASLRTSPWPFSLAVRDDSLAVALSLEK